MKLLSPRAATQQTGVPWRELRVELERAGYRVVRIGARQRVAAEDLAGLIERGRQPTAGEVAARTDLAIEQACRELGITPRRRRRAAGGS